MLSEGLHPRPDHRGDRARLARETPRHGPAAPAISRASRPAPHALETGLRRAAPQRPLSRREREILDLLCLRLTDYEIAERLFVSRRTVTTHVSNILAKLDVSNRREAAAMAPRLLPN